MERSQRASRLWGPDMRQVIKKTNPHTIYLLRSAEVFCGSCALLLPLTGADETVAATLKFSNNRMAVLTWSSALKLRNEAIIVGTKGTIRVGHCDILQSDQL